MVSEKAFRTCFFFAIVVLIVRAQDELSSSKSKVDCVNDLVDLCKSKSQSAVTGEMITASFTDLHHDSQTALHILCTSNSGGTNCTINASPWLYCSSDKQVFYKGKPLKKNSKKNTDNDICYPINLKMKIRNKVEKYMSQVDNKLKELDDKFTKKIESFTENLSNFGNELKTGLQNGLQNGIASLEHNIKSEVKGGLKNEIKNLDTGLSHIRDNLNKLDDELSKPCFPFC